MHETDTPIIIIIIIIITHTLLPSVQP